MCMWEVQLSVVTWAYPHLPEPAGDEYPIACGRAAKGQQPTFSRKLASKQLALRVSPDKQMVTVCTQGECYQAVIISQAAICPPNRSPQHASH